MSLEIATILLSPLSEGEEIEFETNPEQEELSRPTPFVLPTLPTFDFFTAGFLNEEPQRRELALASARSTDDRLR